MSDTVREPIVEEGDGSIERLRTLSNLLDNAIRIPGTNYRIGLDPLVGLLPVVGDVPTTAASAYVVFEAARIGAPRETLARMVVNLAIDAVFGSIPIIGDVFDATWKANARNVTLLEARAADPAARADRRFLLAFAAVLLVGLLALSWLVLWLLVRLFGEVGGLL